MPDFWYSGLTDSGTIQDGVLSAPNEAALEDELRQRGVFLIRTEVREGSAKPGFTDGRIERRELLAFFEYVAGSFDVGIPLLEILDDVSGHLQSKRLLAVVTEIRYAVAEEGKSLSTAMSEHPVAFAELYVGTIRAGEATGQLGYAMRQLVDYMDWQETITSQLKQATLYPVIVICAVVMLVIGLIGFVFPRIIPMLRSQKIALPWPTRVILALSGFVRSDWLIVVLAVNAILLLAYAAYRTTRGRLVIDSLALRVPIIGSVVRDVNMARIVTYLSLFYRTGVELVLSLTLVERVIENRVVARAVGQAREQVTEGVSMAAAFGASPLFPTIIVRTIALGEATGNLDEALGRARGFYSREIPAAVRRMITILQPVLIALIGGVILTVALAIILPILNIYNSIGHR
ncbi:MAG: type II secretion system F family protein [Gemmatimonadales bacterium]